MPPSVQLDDRTAKTGELVCQPFFKPVEPFLDKWPGYTTDSDDRSWMSGRWQQGEKKKWQENTARRELTT